MKAEKQAILKPGLVYLNGNGLKTLYIYYTELGTILGKNLERILSLSFFYQTKATFVPFPAVPTPPVLYTQTEILIP